jgi:hypothetical protein
MRWAIPIACALMLATTVAHAEPTDAEATAAARRVLMALRVLAYDKTLANRRPGETITIAVVSPATSLGRAERTRWLAGFALLPKVKVGGRALRVVAFDVGGDKAFDALVVQHGPAALIVASDLGRALTTVINVARTRDVLSISTNENDVRAGLAVGLIAGRRRDEIVINLESSRAEGVRFGAGLLQLARLTADE